MIIDPSILSAIASPRRREILRLVWKNERSAGDIARAMPDVTFGAVSLQLRALKQANLEPKAIDYINAHGTSTPLNDLNETKAIKNVFGEAAYDVSITGGGEFYGGFIAKDVSLGNSKTSIHYDEALGRLGGGPDYTVLSFAEDVR